MIIFGCKLIIKTINKAIKFLKTLPENSGQKVEMETSNGMKKFYFMWFYDKKRIDLKPCDNIGIYTVHERFWDRINLVF
jgi:hypothetical protein